MKIKNYSPSMIAVTNVFSVSASKKCAFDKLKTIEIFCSYSYKFLGAIRVTNEIFDVLTYKKISFPIGSTTSTTVLNGSEASIPGAKSLS